EAVAVSVNVTPSGRYVIADSYPPGVRYQQVRPDSSITETTKRPPSCEAGQDVASLTSAGAGADPSWRATTTASAATAADAPAAYGSRRFGRSFQRRANIAGSPRRSTARLSASLADEPR